MMKKVTWYISIILVILLALNAAIFYQQQTGRIIAIILTPIILFTYGIHEHLERKEYDERKRNNKKGKL